LSLLLIALSLLDCLTAFSALTLCQLDDDSSELELLRIVSEIATTVTTKKYQG